MTPTGQIPGSSCPRCTAPLMVITKRNFQYFDKNPQFVGCTAYPACGYVTTLTEEVEKKMQTVQAEREAVTVDF